MEMTIIVPRGILNAIQDHAQAENPAECCGLLSGVDGIVDLLHPLRNNSTDPTRRYFAAPEDIFDAMREMRSGGRSLLAIYHSHPAGRAYPSQTDIELAFYPHVAYLIQSLDPQPEARAYRIVDQEVTEIRIEVVEAEWEQRSQFAFGAAASNAGAALIAPDEPPAVAALIEEIPPPEPHLVETVDSVTEEAVEEDVEPGTDPREAVVTEAEVQVFDTAELEIPVPETVEIVPDSVQAEPETVAEVQADETVLPEPEMIHQVSEEKEGEFIAEPRIVEEPQPGFLGGLIRKVIRRVRSWF